MVAAALGQSDQIRVVDIPLNEDTESAYAIYDGDRLSKLAITNLQGFNQTTTTSRPSREYKFQVPGRYRRARVERLIAPGSDAVANVTFGGVSYAHDLQMGRPVVLDARRESVEIQGGVLGIEVPDSSAVLLSLV